MQMHFILANDAPKHCLNKNTIYNNSQIPLKSSHYQVPKYVGTISNIIFFMVFAIIKILK